MSLVFNPLTGSFEFKAQKNFSYNYIPLGCTICVPMYQQMIVADHMDVYGDLDLIGDLAIV